jgi:hypothetical protein
LQRKLSARRIWTEENLHNQNGRCRRSNNRKVEEQEDISRRNFGIQEDFKRVGKLISRSS